MLCEGARLWANAPNGTAEWWSRGHVHPGCITTTGQDTTGCLAKTVRPQIERGSDEKKGAGGGGVERCCMGRMAFRMVVQWQVQGARCKVQARVDDGLGAVSGRCSGEGKNG